HMLHRQLQHMLRTCPSGPVALFLVNIDRFRLFIGSLGYLFCDQLLSEVAQRLRQQMEAKAIEGRLYHFEADTFALVVKGDIPYEQIAQMLLAAFHQPIYLNHREFCVSVSIGLSVFPRDGQNLTQLMRAADLALQQAKQQGGNGWCRYHPELEPPISQPLALEGYLRHAIEHNELALYYQPQVRLADGRLCGAEITLRWHHPEHRLIPPEDFIPLAEEAGLIGPITEWLLKKALMQLQHWQQQGRSQLRLAVNISAYQFHQQHLPQLLQQLLHDHPVDPGLLELELTESAAMLDIDHTAQVLRELRTLGIKLALDDFGTGFSSLSYLRRFPLDTLKIDRSFVQPIPRDQGSNAIVRGIIQLGHSLHLSILAEGIETPQQLELLRRFGCDEGQGYLFGRPMPLPQFEALLDRGLPPQWFKSRTLAR
ncbi:MAG TPA: bifunctional diguanylate cyclase/phosphodiesterase, partial [Methylothermaceae bacterium]|nr:bifunctional diguanylate cyclase/phosphodiesterase [Methylothermaceae bacterium]